MFTHDQVWHGIDRLARERGLTASGLARRAGLDPTTFNPSKRVTKQSKPRWPSTESLAKILSATETSLDDFVALMADRPFDARAVTSHRLRCIAMDQAARPELFDEAGFPVGPGVGRDRFPNLEDVPRLCARGARRRFPADLPRRRPPDRFARRRHPPARSGDAARPRPARSMPGRCCAAPRSGSRSRRSPTIASRRCCRSRRWRGWRGSSGSVSSRGAGLPRRDPIGTRKEGAAGKPAAEATGRHHNVREDIGLIAAGLKAPPAAFKPLMV